jgi:hypothetical protein
MEVTRKNATGSHRCPRLELVWHEVGVVIGGSDRPFFPVASPQCNPQASREKRPPGSR